MVICSNPSRPMIGSKKNRLQMGQLECQWGCCKSEWLMDKKMSHHILRQREKNLWKKEEDNH